MDAERRTSKGGFLQLFDWNAKSRKKLFSNKSEAPVTSNQGKHNVVKSKDHPHLIEVCENGLGPRGQRSCDYSFPSPVSSDDGYGTKAPGVVARLMGLDSLPTSTVTEPSSTPFCDSFSANSCSQKSTSSFQIDYRIMNSIPNVRFSSNPADPRLQKVQNRPIERFQTEMLPPRSAKPISLTHHRLLSPIKTPGFIPTNDIEYVMTTASKMFDQCPPSATKAKKLSFGSSSVPLRIRDLREKMEVVQRASVPPKAFERPKDPVVTKYDRGQSREKGRSGLTNTQTLNASLGSEKETLGRLKNKGKSVPLSVQAKANLQENAGLTSSNSRRSINRKEAEEVKMGQLNQRRINGQRSVQKRNSISRTSGVLKQNNQKQNCLIARDKILPRDQVPSSQNKKSPMVSGSDRIVKASTKVPNSAAKSRKINTIAGDTGKQVMSSKTKTISEKAQIGHRNMYFEDAAGNNITITKDERQIKCNITHDGCLNWDASEGKNSMDVVSFTFNSPIKKPVNVSESSGKHMEENGVGYRHQTRDDVYFDPKNSTLYSTGSAGITGGDALSVLLDQKLKELALRVESSNCNIDKACSAGLEDLRSTSTFMDNSPSEHCIGIEQNLHKDKSSRAKVVNCTSVDGALPEAIENWQGLKEMEGHFRASKKSEYRTELDSRYANFSSNLEASSSDGSCDLSDLSSISLTNGCKRFLLAEPQVISECISSGISQSADVDYEFADTASSSSVAYMSGISNSPAVSLMEFKRSSNWEVEYITKILFSSDLVLEDLVLGQVNKAITPSLFDHLENSQLVCSGNEEDYFKLERKALFDSVKECLELKSQQFFSGNCKALSKWAALFRRKACLAEEIYKEISAWTSMGDLMVDELVNNDMSYGKGKWVDFEAEAFEEGLEIEKGILTGLVDELVADLLLT